MVFEIKHTESSAANERNPSLELPIFTGSGPSIAGDGAKQSGQDSGDGSGGADVTQTSDTGTVSDESTKVPSDKPAAIAKSGAEERLGQSSVRWGNGTIDIPEELFFGAEFNKLLPADTDTKDNGDKPDAGAKAGGDKPTAAPDKKDGSDWLTDTIQKTVFGLPNLIVETTMSAPEMLLHAASDASNVAQKVADANDIASNLASFLGLGDDKEAQRIIATAERGKKHIDANDEQYVKQWKKMEPPQLAPPSEGDNPAKYTHKNADGSSYTVTDGKITELSTAPSKQNPKGVTYSEITYDKNGDVNSYLIDGQQRHRKMSGADTNGIAKWRSTNMEENKFSDYAGAGAREWTGKPVFDANGFHNLILTGKNRGSLDSTEIDGSLTTTRSTYDAYNRLQRIDTTSTLPDNTKVSKGSKYNSGQFTRDDTNIKVRESDSPKISQVKFDETGKKGEVVEAPKPKEQQTTPGDKLMSFVRDAVSPGGLGFLEDLNALSLRRTGPNSFDVRGHLDNVYMPPPNVSVGGFGPLGRVSASPQGSRVNLFDGQLSIADNQVSLTNMHGFDGQAALTRTGFRGKTKHIGTTATSTKGMTWDAKHGLIYAESDRTTLALDARNFDANSLSGKLLTQPETKKNVLAGLKTFNDNLDKVALVQTSPGVFEGSFETKQKQFDIGGKIPGLKTKLYLNDRVHVTKNKDGLSFKEGDLAVGVQVGNSLESRTSVSRLSTSVDKDGKPVIKVEFHNKKEPFEIPLTEAAKPKDATSTPPKPKDAAPTPPKEAQPKVVPSEPPKTMPLDATKKTMPPGEVKPDGPKQPVPANLDKPAADQVKPKSAPVTHRPTNIDNNCNTHRRRGILRRR